MASEQTGKIMSRLLVITDVNRRKQPIERGVLGVYIADSSVALRIVVWTRVPEATVAVQDRAWKWQGLGRARAKRVTDGGRYGSIVERLKETESLRIENGGKDRRLADGAGFIGTNRRYGVILEMVVHVTSLAERADVA